MSQTPSVSTAIRTDLSVSALGRPAFGQPAHRAAAGRRPYRRSVGTQRPRRPSEPGCRWTAQRADHRSIAGAVSGTGDGKAGRPIPPIPAAAEVSRRTGNAFGPGASRGYAHGPAASGRDREDRSLGRAGGGAKKPHLCGPEARHHGSRSAAGARERRRWRTTSHTSLRSPATPSSCRLGRFTLWAAASWCSRFSRTAT